MSYIDWSTDLDDGFYDGLLKGAYQGAIVRCWRTGLYINDVYKVDVKSMYPSIMIVWNLSPETTWLIRRSKYTGSYYFGKDRIEVPDDRLGQITLGIAKEDGITRGELLNLRAERDRIRNSVGNVVEIDSQQRGIKLIMNSLYGYHGLQYSRYGSMLVAVAVTSIGRYIMKQIIRLCEQSKLECDTDGLLIHSPNRSGNAVKNQINTFLEGHFEDYEYASELKVDLDSFDGALIYKAKNYILKNGLKFKFKGSSFHGRHMPQICDVAMRKFAKAIFDRRNPNEVWGEFERLRNYPLRYFTMSVQFNKQPSDYEKGSLYQKLSAKLGNKVYWGEDIYYVKLKRGFYPLGLLSDEELRRRLDYPYYRERIKDVVRRLTGPLNTTLGAFM